MRITAKDLRAASACKSGRRLFRKNFGNGGEVDIKKVQWAYDNLPYSYLHWVIHKLMRPEAKNLFLSLRDEAWSHGSYLWEWVVPSFMTAVAAHEKALRAMG